MKPQLHKIWKLENPDLNNSFTLAAELGVSPFVAKLLVNRGLKNVSEAHAYLYPQFDALHSPFKLANMDKAITRIKRAIKLGEKIYIYGDYDADGTTATAVLYNAFRHIDMPIEAYIPNRFTDGYGLSKKTVETLHSNGAQLLITVDCGVTSKAEVELANQLGMDVIITDHHQPNPHAIPPAYALISPLVQGNEYPYPHLAGVGLAYKLAHGLIDDEMFLMSLLDLVALGTVVDMVPLTGENRALSRLGLDVLNKRERPGIRALCDVAGYDVAKPLVGQSLSFGLGPRINAAGRMDAANKVVKLFTTESDDEAKRIAAELNQENRKRQELEINIRDKAEEIIKKEMDENTIGMVVASNLWSEKAQGVVGIVASRLLETYHKPVFVIAIKGEEATGSGRSIDGMNLAACLKNCSNLLIKHGGHAAAAGLTLKSKNIPRFKQAFNDYARKELSAEALQPKLELDFETSLSLLTLKSLEELTQLEPFGRENPAPSFSAHHVKINGIPYRIGKGKQHLRMFVQDGESKLCAIAWGKGEHLVTFKREDLSLDIAFSPQINEWRDTRSVQLILQDWQIRSNSREVKRAVFPTSSDASVTQVIDGRGENKKDYLLNLIARAEPCIIYVQNREMLDQLRTHLIPEKTHCIGPHDETVSEGTEKQLLKKLKHGELQAIASSANFSQPDEVTFVKYFVFCHLAPSSDEFFKRCQPAFAADASSELHLIYNDSDAKRLASWMSQKYPEEADLRELYKNLRALIQNHGADGCPEVELINRQVGATDSVQTALTIFEELGFFERHGEQDDSRIYLLTPQKRGLANSKTYLRGEWIKQTSRSFVDFQLQEDIKPIWERIENECQLANQPNSKL